LTTLWFERAQKVLSSLDHLYKLLEFLSYIALLSHRFTNDYLVMLADSKSIQSIQASQELKGMLELYSTYQLDYDYYDYKNGHTF
jgi:hypothetical protein